MRERYFLRGAVFVRIAPAHVFLFARREGKTFMRKVNTNQMSEQTWSSPKGKFAAAGKDVSEELGRKPQSTDLRERHPFDVEICRVPPGKSHYPFHSHSAQWEFYHVISGRGKVRHKDGTTAIEPGDAFIFPPDEPHQLSTTVRKIWFCTSSPTIRLVNPVIIPIVKNGSCVHLNES